MVGAYRQWRLLGDLEGLEEGLNLISRELGIRLGSSGLAVSLVRRAGPLEIRYAGGEGRICFERDIHLYRGLGLLAERLLQISQDGQDSLPGFTILEQPRFAMCGAMFDCSRNGVLRPESVQFLLRKLALMGLDTVLLYTEDTYEVEGAPYFGYMRGRYTFEELKGLDDYAAQLGIELVPCIQTLGHMEAYLKWEEARALRDTPDILLAGEANTYRVIGEMIEAASRPFRSRRIHIGMDEAHGIGLGRYLERFGYRRRFDIMTDHLNRVLEITSRLGLAPMIWSDMYFRLASQTGDYYDPAAVIPKDVADRIPSGAQLVYWDYYHQEESFYRDYIRKHKELGENPVFAGGVWTFSGFCTNYAKTLTTTQAALTACKEEGVQEVFAALWLDDGAENHPYSGLLGLQLYAEHAYAGQVEEKTLCRRFDFCVGAGSEAFLRLTGFDAVPGADILALEPDNPAKYLLWQDPLLGIFDAHMDGIDAGGHYTLLQQQLAKALERYPHWSSVLAVPVRLSAVLALKAELGVRLRRYYQAEDRSSMAALVHTELPELVNRVRLLREEHRRQWFAVYKPFGWEVLDLRYGGLLSRLDSAEVRLRDWLEGRTGRLEELEEKRLPADGLTKPRAQGLGRCNRYIRIASTGVF